MKKDLSLHIIPERDGFASDMPIAVSNAGDKISFNLESRSKTAHNTKLNVSGLPNATYLVKVNGKTIAEKKLQKSQDLLAEIDVPAKTNTLIIEISRK